jgi:WD40 repeat protein
VFERGAALRIARSWLEVVSLLLLCISLDADLGMAVAANDADHLECVLATSADSARDERVKNILNGLTADQLEDLAGSKNPLTAKVAARILAARYESGQGVTKDLEKAAQIYRQAAFVFPALTTVYSPGFGNVPGSTITVGGDGPLRVKDIPALQRLGEMYRDGIGIDQDSRQAKVLLDCAAKLAAAIQSPPPPKPLGPGQYRVPGLPRDLILNKPSPAPTADSAVLDQQAASFSLPDNVDGLAWSPDGSRLAATYDRGHGLAVIDAGNGRTIWHRRRAQEVIGASERVLEFSPDGKALLVVAPVGDEIGLQGRDQTVALLSVKDGSVRKIFKRVRSRADGLATAFSAVFDDENHRILFVSPDTLNKIMSYDGDGNMSDVFALPSTRGEFGTWFVRDRLAVDAQRNTLWWAHEGVLQSISLREGQPLMSVRAFNEYIQAVAIDPETGDLVAGGTTVVDSVPIRDGELGQGLKTYQDDATTVVRAFRATDGSIAHTYPGPGGTVQGVSVSQGGRYVAASKSRMMGISPSYILLWNARNGQLLSAKDCGDTEVGNVAFDPTGTQLAYAVGSRIYISKLPQ